MKKIIQVPRIPRAPRSHRAARHPRGRVLRRGLLSAAALAGTVGLLSTGAFSEDERQLTPEDVRAVIAEWIEVDTQISQEKQAWALKRQTQLEEIELARLEIETLKERLATTEKEITTASEEEAALIEAGRELDEAAEVLKTSVLELEKRVQALLPRLPDPLLERIASLTQRLPENLDDPEHTKRGPRDRFQVVLGILNAANKFNRDITVASEVRELGPGRESVVSVMYVGVSQAYFVTKNRDAAGFGRATDEGWVWTRADEHAEAIELAIQVYENTEPAAFVQLPLQLPPQSPLQSNGANDAQQSTGEAR